MKKYFGYSDNRADVELNNVDEVVDFIVHEGMAGNDITICDGETLEVICTTFGPYLDRVTPEFRTELMAHRLIEKQMAAEEELLGGEE